MDTDVDFGVLSVPRTRRAGVLDAMVLEFGDHRFRSGAGASVLAVAASAGRPLVTEVFVHRPG